MGISEHSYKYTQLNLEYFQLRVLSNPNARKLKSIGKEFILAQVIVSGGSDYMDKLTALHDSIVGRVLEMSVIGRVSVQHVNGKFPSH